MARPARFRTFVAVCIAALALGCFGCGTTGWYESVETNTKAAQPDARSSDRDGAPYRYKQRNADGAAPASPAKSAEERRKFRERHPSLWRRKLKATFT